MEELILLLFDSFKSCETSTLISKVLWSIADVLNLSSSAKSGNLHCTFLCAFSWNIIWVFFHLTSVTIKIS